ncbi:MAG: hypothetical protein IKL24_05165 [Clostridia bacterium]|nr:hypothetical protein [Clostridia bacterium]
MFKSIFTFAPLPKVLPGIAYLDLVIVAVSLVLLFATSWYREKGHSIRDELAATILPIRWGIFLLTLAAVVLLGIYGPGYSDSAFIYMNF